MPFDWNMNITTPTLTTGTIGNIPYTTTTSSSANYYSAHTHAGVQQALSSK